MAAGRGVLAMKGLVQVQSLEICSLGHVDLEAGKAASRPLQELTQEMRDSTKTYNLSWRPVWGLEGIGGRQLQGHSWGQGH